MAIPWDAIRSLAVIVLPFILPRALAFYRSVRSGQSRQSLAAQPVPRKAALVLGGLGLLSATLLLAALPAFAPENLFRRTASRLQIPTDTLFHRLEALRPAGALSDRDLALRARLVSTDARLLYFQHGPAALAECAFCSSDEPASFLAFALPAILAPHLANAAALALATSPAAGGPHAAAWRSAATLAQALLAAGDLALVASYDRQANRLATRLQDLDMFFWRARAGRLLALAALDAALAALLWLSSTNRAFALLPTPAQRVDAAARALHAVKSKASALAIVRNTALRDEDLRGRVQAYWAHEVRLMGEVMEEREVIEGVNDALENRLNIQNISRDAEVYAQSVLQPLEEVTATDEK